MFASHTVNAALPLETPSRTKLLPFITAPTADGLEFCVIEKGPKPDIVTVWLSPTIRLTAVELNEKVDIDAGNTLTVSTWQSLIESQMFNAVVP